MSRVTRRHFVPVDDSDKRRVKVNTCLLHVCMLHSGFTVHTVLQLQEQSHVGGGGGGRGVGVGKTHPVR